MIECISKLLPERPHHKLKVWEASIRFARALYNITKSFPAEERYSLTSQLRRAAISIPSNIAEGATRQSKKDFIRFLDYSMSSISEVETQLILSVELGYIDTAKNQEFNSAVLLLSEISKMVAGLKRSCRNT